MNTLNQKPHLVALLCTIALILWMVSGYWKQADAAVENPQTLTTPANKKSLFSVQVREQKAETLVREILLTGRTAPYRSVKLRAEISGKIASVPVVRGAFVKQGDVIVQFDLEARQAHVNEAQALVKQREAELKALQNLSQQGFQAKISVPEAQALLESAKSALKLAQLDFEHLVIRAPFSGVLETRSVEVGQYLSVGDDLAELIDINPLLVLADVTERERVNLHLGSTVKAHLITGENIEGKLQRISSQASQATRLFTVEVEFANATGKLAAGITTELRIPLETVMAHKISSALLALDDSGVLGVKAVDAEQRVLFYPAQVARTDNEALWLKGLPDTVRFITVGQGFVKTGDKVNAILQP